MKNLKLLFPLFIFVCLGTYLFTIQKEIQQVPNIQNNRLASKQEPSDQFFAQRSYPDGKFNIRNYTNALIEAKEEIAFRSGSTGIDTPWKIQGPGNIGARANTIAVHPTDDAIMYTGFSTGGVWKTIDDGESWNPIFDDQIFLAIGDIAIDPNNPNTIYVGTGDANITGYPHIGNGVYKSTDAGATWINIGLETTRIISEIIIHPSDSETIYVSTMGLPFEENTDRGLYKSTDGGATWNQILFVDTNAGIIDMVMQPDNPDVIYAAAWNRIRNNYDSFVIGDDAKIHKTIDGGLTWTILGGGLPQGELGRIGLAISEQNPETLYAMYVDTTSTLKNLYKTEDGGTTWNAQMTEEEVESFSPLGGFGWYFGKIRVNPTDDNDIFMLGVDLWRSLDGGTNWVPASPPWWEYSVHADKHDLVFTDSGRAILATDGGLYKVEMGSQEWIDIESIPTTQFYRVAYNPHRPDWYYGGAQDNGTTGGNAVMINEWPRIFGGDGFQALFHPTNPDVMYAETQRGGIVYSNDGGYEWDSGDRGIDDDDNRNWDMPYIMSPHNPEVLYAGTDRIYRSFSDDAPDWESISDNLTDVDTSDSRYHNITTLDESPLIEGLLYVGTGDGNVLVTEDGGANWNVLSDDLPNQYVTSIHASPHEENTVYISYSGYRDNDNSAKIYKSVDKGNTWEPLNGNLPEIAINDIWVYPNYQDSVIFIATDAGVYSTQNAGITWDRLGSEMPVVPVFDVVWNEANNELVAGTFARSIMSFPLDSIDVNTDFFVSNENIKPIINKSALRIYPNPATDYIQLEFSNTEKNKIAEIVVLDAQGRLLINQKNSQEGSVQERINIQDLSAGNYFVKVKIRHTILSGQFVKI